MVSIEELIKNAMENAQMEVNEILNGAILYNSEEKKEMLAKILVEAAKIKGLNVSKEWFIENFFPNSKLGMVSSTEIVAVFDSFGIYIPELIPVVIIDSSVWRKKIPSDAFIISQPVENDVGALIYRSFIFTKSDGLARTIIHEILHYIFDKGVSFKSFVNKETIESYKKNQKLIALISEISAWRAMLVLRGGSSNAWIDVVKTLVFNYVSKNEREQEIVKLLLPRARYIYENYGNRVLSNFLLDVAIQLVRGIENINEFEENINESELQNLDEYVKIIIEDVDFIKRATRELVNYIHVSRSGKENVKNALFFQFVSPRMIEMEYEKLINNYKFMHIHDERIKNMRNVLDKYLKQVRIPSFPKDELREERIIKLKSGIKDREEEHIKSIMDIKKIGKQKIEKEVSEIYKIKKEIKNIFERGRKKLVNKYLKNNI